MYFPIASPNENMNIDSSIRPMPARCPECPSWPAILSGGIICFPFKTARLLAPIRPLSRERGRQRGVTTSPRLPGETPCARCFTDVDQRYKPHHRRQRQTRASADHDRIVAACSVGYRYLIRLDDVARNAAMTEFDPASHRMVSKQRWFEDFTVGERFV